MDGRDQWDALKKLLVIIGLAIASWAIVVIIICLLKGGAVIIY